MVYSRNTDHIYERSKKTEKTKKTNPNLIQGAGLEVSRGPSEGNRGFLGNRRRVGRVEVASPARGARECARRPGSHCLRKLSTETLYVAPPGFQGPGP